MSTVVTRALAAKDRFDRISIRVDPDTYVSKYGVFTVTLTSITWTSGTNISTDTGKVNLTPSNDTENKYLDDFALTATVGSNNFSGITSKHIAAVNNGQPGPSIRQNPDGTWDIMDLTWELPDGNVITDPVTLTLTYTIAFTDLTATVGVTTGSVTLNVTNIKLQDQGYISQALSAMSGQNGYVLATLTSLVTTVIDQPPDAPIMIGDLVPLFQVNQLNTQFIQYLIPKTSGTKNFTGKRFVIAINNGVGDANSTVFTSTAGQMLIFLAQLLKNPQWECNDYVTAVLNHTVDYTQIT